VKALKNILVVVDPTASVHPCIEKAEILAKAFKARIELLGCDSRAAQESRAAEQVALRGDAAVTTLKKSLESLATPMRARGLDIATTALCIEPLHSAVTKHAELCDADMVIKDTHHHSLAKRTLITNTDWHLIRDCSRPLLLTKATPWHEKATIVAALDPGHEGDKPILLDQQLLSWAESLGKHLKGTVHAAHAFLPAVLVAGAVSYGGTPMWIPAFGELMNSEIEQKMVELKSLVRDYSIAANNIHVEIGSPRDALELVVQRVSADILVTGAISRNTVKGLFIGSTAERILERIPCDIFVIKPPNFSVDLPF
jgi:universal stress protein E